MGSTELMQVPNFMQTDTDFSFSFPAFIRLSKGHERLRSTCGLNCRGNWSGDPRVCCFNGQSCGFRAPPAHNQGVPASCPGTFLTVDVNQVTSHHFRTSEYEDTPPVRTSKGYAMDREATMWTIRAGHPGGPWEGATLTWMAWSHTLAWALGQCVKRKPRAVHHAGIQRPTSPALYRPPAQSPVRAEQTRPSPAHHASAGCAPGDGAFSHSSFQVLSEMQPFHL